MTALLINTDPINAFNQFWLKANDFFDEENRANKKMKQNYSDSDVIWRYMDLSKLLSLFEMRKLFLSQISKFEDKYEGFYPVKDFIDPNDEFYSVISEEMVNELINVLKSGFYANCWHINSHESFAMWKIYSNKGIAIKTTVGSLKKSLRDINKDLVLFGGVEYLDYHKQSINDYVAIKRESGIYIPMLPVFFKRKEFGFEKEFRIISMKRPNHKEFKELNLKEKFQRIISSAETSFKIDANLDELIQEIYVSPFAEKWYYDLVNKLAKKYQVISPVHKSQIDNNDPSFKKQQT